ncbi:MAG: hydrolase, partial [Clostridiales bacterium]|nr:hydrolase [Clostridiales bacterium]
MKHTRRVLSLILSILLAFTTAVSAFAYSTLKVGSSGSDVVQMQNALKQLGYTVTADGVYGNSTKQVVQQFQADHGLTADGVAGDK